MQTLHETHYQFKGQSGFYRGKVRDVYFFDDIMAVVATDRVSAFDVIFPRPIPDKGRILNQLAAYHLEKTKSILPNWVISTPDPNVTLGFRCMVFPVEIVVRGYLAGHAWREYKAGKRTLCGVPLPEGLKEHDPLPHPIITPATKAATGHDEDITKEEIITHKLVDRDDYEALEDYALKLYTKGTALAAERGLILVDTKYEFGKRDDILYLVDEVHTPDSSRYFYKEGYEKKQKEGSPQKHLSKEFVRQWAIEKGFQGKEGQHIPKMTDEVVESISNRYKELYRHMTNTTLNSIGHESIYERIEKTITNSLSLIL